MRCEVWAGKLTYSECIFQRGFPKWVSYLSQNWAKANTNLFSGSFFQLPQSHAWWCAQNIRLYQCTLKFNIFKPKFLMSALGFRLINHPRGFALFLRHLTTSESTLRNTSACNHQMREFKGHKLCLLKILNSKKFVVEFFKFYIVKKFAHWII